MSYGIAKSAETSHFRSRANPNQDVADLRKRMEGEEFLDVIGIDSVENAENSCDRSQYDERQLNREHVGQPEQSHHAHLDDQAGQQR